MLVWSLDEPERIGEVIFPPPRGGKVLFGRGPAQSSDPHDKVALVRQRPDDVLPTGPVASPRISRHQMTLRVHKGQLRVENLGRTPLRFGGQEVKRCAVDVGQCFELKNQMVFYVTQRSPSWAPERFGTGERHDFGRPDADGIVGESRVLWKLREQFAFLAQREQHVLLLGESGTGKELVAGAMHRRSARSRHTMVRRNAATIPEGLFDAELFGNARNYPNTGMPERDGLVGAAHRSTFFLDEIGELPGELQAHLLRLLDTGGEYHRLGESTMRRSDLRLIAATNRPAASLKHDFLARFALRLQLPSLNDRPEDVPLLARHLLLKTAEEDPALAELYVDEATGMPRIAPELIIALMQHRWTLHVRELERLLWSAITSCDDGWLRLSPTVKQDLTLAHRDAAEEAFTTPAELTPEAIQACIDKHGGVQEKIWRDLGLKNRYVLRRLIKKHNLNPKGSGAR